MFSALLRRRLSELALVLRPMCFVACHFFSHRARLQCFHCLVHCLGHAFCSLAALLLCSCVALCPCCFVAPWVINACVSIGMEPVGRQRVGNVKVQALFVRTRFAQIVVRDAGVRVSVLLGALRAERMFSR